MAQYGASGTTRPYGSASRIPDFYNNTVSKKPKACVPCHSRKVKCDASIKGLPCSRCVTSTRTDECVLHPTQESSRKRKRSRTSVVMNRNSYDQELNSPTAPYSRTHVEPLISEQGLHSYALPNLQTPLPQATLSNVRGSDRVDNYSYGQSSGQDSTRAQPYARRTSAAHSCASSPRSESIAEEDVQAHICQELTSDKRSSQPSSKPSASHEIIEYQNQMTTQGILGEILRSGKRRKLVKVIIASPDSRGNVRSPGQRFQRTRDMELSGLDKADEQFLYAKGAFDIPPATVCEEFLQLYFRYVYPYAPCLDRRAFLCAYEAGQHSSFLFQALLANVVPYASIDLIRRAGFPDHPTAQEAFFKRAIILNDLGCEKRQLHLLQGSLLLGTQWVSFAGDKDYRFWLLNAIRIATRMGLHRDHIGEELDPATHKLFRRIWWIIYIRDVVCTVSGIENVRRINIEDCDTKPLLESDWMEETAKISPRLEHLLPPTTTVHKSYLIETCRLVLIGDKYNQLCRSITAGKPILEEAVTELIDSFPRWRDSLPREMRPDCIQWSTDSVWVLILMSWCYRLECMVYWALQRCYEETRKERKLWAYKKLHSTMFELDTLVRRASMHEMAPLLPMSFSISVGMLMALHVGDAIDRSLPKSQRTMSEVSIQSGLTYLREAQKTWSSIRWTLRLFDWVFKKTGLNLRGENESSPNNIEPPKTPPGHVSEDPGVSSALESDVFFMDPLLYTGVWDLNQNMLRDDPELDMENWQGVGMPWVG